MNVKRTFLITLVPVLVTGCATTPDGPTTAPYHPVFEFTPLDTLPPGSAGISVALVRPEYPEQERWAQVAPGFAENMPLDFQELLISRGYTTRGPYRSQAEMVYQDKEQSDLLLTPKLEVRPQVTDVEYDSSTRLRLFQPGSSTVNVYRIESATVRVGGRVTFEISEPFTQERLWAPSVELEPSIVTFAGELEHDRELPDDAVFREPAFRNAVAEALEEMYTIILEDAWRRLDPAELQVYKAQAMEIAERAGYVRR